MAESFPVIRRCATPSSLPLSSCCFSSSSLSRSLSLFYLYLRIRGTKNKAGTRRILKSKSPSARDMLMAESFPIIRPWPLPIPSLLSLRFCLSFSPLPCFLSSLSYLIFLCEIRSTGNKVRTRLVLRYFEVEIAESARHVDGRVLPYNSSLDHSLPSPSVSLSLRFPLSYLLSFILSFLGDTEHWK
jgi:hypothetical protein